MEISKLILVAAVALTSGCASKAPIKSDPYEVARAVNFQSEGIRELQPVTVRSYRRAVGQKTEISVENCILFGNGYKVEFTTPAKINVPNYGRNMPRPKVECTLDGDTVTSTAGRTNETELEIFGGMIAGTGLFGPQAALAASAIALGAITVRPGKDSDEFSIQNVDIVFREDKTSASAQDF